MKVSDVVWLREGDTFLDIFDVTRSQGDADAVDFDRCLGLFFFFSSFSDYTLAGAGARFAYRSSSWKPEGD